MGDAGDPVAAYEWLSATYGWGPADIERHFSHEQLVGYLDAAQERVAVEAERAIEAVRAGTIFAHDQRAFDRWRRRAASASSTGRQSGRGLDAAGLERYLGVLAMTHPDLVALPGQPVRRMHAQRS